MGDANSKPDADRQERQSKCESRNVGQHPVPKIVRFFPVALIAREIVGYFELAHRLAGNPTLRRSRCHRARPELEHPVLFFV
jgi:hypothetical protein